MPVRESVLNSASLIGRGCVNRCFLHTLPPLQLLHGYWHSWTLVYNEQGLWDTLIFE